MQKIVFTNGCFDILHPGHVDLLERCKSLGTKLIVGINSDDSVKKIKGAERPFLDEESRKAVLLGLKSVDEVYIFNELTPENLIKQINPQILVKGGDWKVTEIIGADYVLKSGGEVFSLPLKGDFSSSAVVEKIRRASRRETNLPKSEAPPRRFSVRHLLDQHVEVFNNLSAEQISSIEEAAVIIEQTFRSRNKLLICGNGDSAANAQHIAADFISRCETKSKPLPAIALTTDTSALTALANDYNFEMIFARQIEALAAEGDCLIAFSAGENSSNLIAAAMNARRKNCKIIGLTGANGKKLASLCDVCVFVPSEINARIQEVQMTVANIWCEIVDRNLNRD